jgi:hypothetical protein
LTSTWPGGAQASISITVDNLGEAAEIALGLRSEADHLGGHPSVTTGLPLMLELLDDLPATFFVEGINAEVYPEALAEITGAGHEIGFHAWCHEDWAGLDPEERAANLERGVKAFAALGIEPRGFRPPGGLFPAETPALLDRRGLIYCSPAGSAEGVTGPIAVLPFAWPAVDVFHVLPQFGALRKHLTGSEKAGGPDGVRDALLTQVESTRGRGGHTCLVLHTWAVEYLGEAVAAVLEQVRTSDDLYLAPCAEVAALLLKRDGGPPQLDSTSWLSPG